MTHKLIETALLEQLVGALEKSVGAMQGLYGGWRCEQPLKLANAAITAGRAAIDGAEPEFDPYTEKLQRKCANCRETFGEHYGDICPDGDTVFKEQP